MLYCNDIVIKRRRPKMKPSRFLKERNKLISNFPLNYKRDPKDDRDFKFMAMRPGLLEAVFLLL